MAWPGAAWRRVASESLKRTWQRARAGTGARPAPPPRLQPQCAARLAGRCTPRKGDTLPVWCRKEKKIPAAAALSMSESGWKIITTRLARKVPCAHCGALRLLRSRERAGDTDTAEAALEEVAVADEVRPLWRRSRAVAPAARCAFV